MNNKAIDELLSVLHQIGADVHETKLKVAAIEAAMKASNPHLYSQYVRDLGDHRKANEGRSVALAEGEAYGRLRSALNLDQIPQKN
jgi:hypothetical protein